MLGKFMPLEADTEKLKDEEPPEKNRAPLWLIIFIFIVFSLALVPLGFFVSQNETNEEASRQVNLPTNWQDLTLNQRILLNPNNCDLRIAPDGFYATKEIMWADGSCHLVDKASVLDWSYAEHCQATLVSPVHYRHFSLFDRWMDYKIVDASDDWMPQEPYAADICGSQILIRTVRDKEAFAANLSQYYDLRERSVVETYLAGDFWLDYFKNCYDGVETEAELPQDGWQESVQARNYFLVSCGHKILQTEFLSLDERRMNAQNVAVKTQNEAGVSVEAALELYCSDQPTTEVEIYLCQSER